ncbi:MAG: PilZ domain-containing protein [Bdellovibrio sp.]|nr:PilZ domain-containing protein [Bdellovibrio sp.]
MHPSHFNIIVAQDKTFCINKPTAFQQEEFAHVTECFFNLNLNRTNLFFKAKFTGFLPGGLNFKIPEKIFKVQRRGFFRLQSKEIENIQISFSHPKKANELLIKKLLDLGEGGMSFLILDIEENLFQPGLIIKNITFQIKDKEIICDGEVRHLQPFPLNSRHKGIKVGIQFHNIKTGTAQWITSFVFEESRKYVTKYL